MDNEQVDISKESQKIPEKPQNNRLKENRENRPMILDRTVCNCICIKTNKDSE